MISLLIGLAVLGLVFYLLDTYVITNPGPFKTVFRAIAVILLCLWLLQAFGIYSLPERLRM
jgi:hypothetical protein